MPKFRQLRVRALRQRSHMLGIFDRGLMAAMIARTRLRHFVIWASLPAESERRDFVSAERATAHSSASLARWLPC